MKYCSIVRLLKEISLCKSLKANYMLCDFRVAVRFPIFVQKNVHFHSLRGKVEFGCTPKPGIVRIGFPGVPIFDRKYSRTVLNIAAGSTVIFNGRCSIGSGSKIGVGGRLTIGENFNMTAESIIICNKEIVFGDDNLISWNCQIMDCDFHDIVCVESGAVVNHPKRIVFGDRIWIGSRVSVMKGVKLADDIVVAASSLVTGEHRESRTIIGGNPARVIKRNCVRVI